MCYRIGDETYYALEGAVEIAGAATKWAQSVGLFKDEKELTELV